MTGCTGRLRRDQSMASFFLWGAVVFLLLMKSACPQTLPEAIGQILGRTELRGSLWGIAVRNRSSEVYSQLPDALLVPASNKKLLTAAAALTSHGSVRVSLQFSRNVVD